MSSPFALARRHDSLDAPSVGGDAITPHDANFLAVPVRALTLNVGGAVSYVDWDGQTHVTAALPAGTYAMLVRRVNATGTTATGITGWV